MSCPAVPPRGYKGNAPTYLRPKGVSSRAHTDVTQALYTKGCTLAKLAPPTCTRHQRQAQKPKKRHFPLPVTGTDEPFAHVGKQHATPALNKRQERTYCLIQRNATFIRSCSRPGSVRRRNWSWHWPSMTRMSPRPRQHKWVSSSGQDWRLRFQSDFERQLQSSFSPL